MNHCTYEKLESQIAQKNEEILQKDNNFNETKSGINYNRLKRINSDKDEIKNKRHFLQELEDIKILNIKISKILWLYYYLSDNKLEEFDKDAEEEYVKRKNKTKKPKNESDNDEFEEEYEGKKIRE